MDRLLLELAAKVAKQARRLAEITVRCTLIGNVNDKTTKNQVASMGVLKTLLPRVGHWGRREFVKALSALTGSAGLLSFVSLLYSLITSSACAKSGCDIVRPIFLAVIRFTTNSNIVGCSIGRSPGLAPFRILPTYPADRRNRSLTFGP